jgi:mannosyltransferase OCH1-like enzyme
MRVDFARTLVLHKFGGVYSDLDVVPVRNISSYVDMVNNWDREIEVALGETNNSMGKFKVTNFIMMSKPGASWWENYWNYVENGQYKTFMPWYFKILMNIKHYHIMGITGPSGLSVVYNRNRKGVHVIPSNFVGAQRGKNVTKNNNNSERLFKHVEGDSWGDVSTLHARNAMYIYDHATEILLVLWLLTFVLCVVFFTLYRQSKTTKLNQLKTKVTLF